jgi:hypothetical protein
MPAGARSKPSELALRPSDRSSRSEEKLARLRTSPAAGFHKPEEHCSSSGSLKYLDYGRKLRA